MNHHQDGPALLESYLDGLLSADQRLAFERELRSRPDLAALIQRQRLIDESLKRALQPPPAGQLIAILDRALSRADSSAAPPATPAFPAITAAETRSAGPPNWNFPLRRLGLAAALIGGILGIVLIWTVVAPRPTYSMPWRAMDAVYRDQIASGFQPKWRCENDEEFQQMLVQEYYQPLLLAQLPANTEALGWDYSNTISRRTLVLLAHADDQRVLVFIDRAAADRGQSIQAGPLHLHQRKLGSLVLYELSPLDRPVLLEKFYIPPAPSSSRPSSTQGETPS